MVVEGLKIRRPSGHGGSTPPPGTSYKFQSRAAGGRIYFLVRSRHFFSRFLTVLKQLGVGPQVTALQIDFDAT